MWGDYYGKDGKHLGNDGIDDNKVYTADSRNGDGTQMNSLYIAFIYRFQSLLYHFEIYIFNKLFVIRRANFYHPFIIRYFDIISFKTFDTFFSNQK